jgi:hypothetical protein
MTSRAVPFVVEGDTDVPFAERVIRAARGEAGTAYIRRGKPKLLAALDGFARAARYQPFLVLVDQDSEHDCAPAARRAWARKEGDQLIFRIVVHSSEAWAMGDGDAAASYFRIRRATLPAEPERIDDPKQRLIDLCRHSSREDVRRDMVPHPGSGRRQGKGYEARLIEFGERHWRLEAARAWCPSLHRAVERLASVLARAR